MTTKQNTKNAVTAENVRLSIPSSADFRNYKRAEKHEEETSL